MTKCTEKNVPIIRLRICSLDANRTWTEVTEWNLKNLKSISKEKNKWRRLIRGNVDVSDYVVPAHQCCPHKWPKPVCCCCCCGKSILTWDHRESEWAHAPVPPAGDATTHRGTTNLELQLHQAFYTDNSQWCSHICSHNRHIYKYRPVFF